MQRAVDTATVHAAAVAAAASHARHITISTASSLGSMCMRVYRTRLPFTLLGLSWLELRIRLGVLRVATRLAKPRELGHMFN